MPGRGPNRVCSVYAETVAAGNRAGVTQGCPTPNHPAWSNRFARRCGVENTATRVEAATVRRMPPVAGFGIMHYTSLVSLS